MRKLGASVKIADSGKLSRADLGNAGLLSLHQACRQYGIPRRRLKAMAERGEIDADTSTPGRLYFTRRALDAAFRSQAPAAAELELLVARLVRREVRHQLGALLRTLVAIEASDTLLSEASLFSPTLGPAVPENPAGPSFPPGVFSHPAEAP